MININALKINKRFLLHWHLVSGLTVITIALYWYWNTCWQLLDPACVNPDISKQVFKYLSVVAQFIGVVFVFKALNDNLRSIRNTSLTGLLVDRIESLITIFNKPSKVNITCHASIPKMRSSVDIRVTGAKQEDETEIQRLERTINDALAEIKNLNSKLVEQQREFDSHAHRISNELTSVKSELSNKIDGIAIGDIRYALWALYMMLYSTIIGALP